MILALIAAIVMAFCAVLNRSLKQTHTAVICFYHSIGGLILSSAYIFIEACINSELRIITYTGRQLGIAASAATFNSGSNVGSTLAY